MEKHTCKLCLRSFANGRALGGHMRSHVAATTKAAVASAAAVTVVKDSSSESSSSRYINDADVDSKATIAMILRENPKKSFRLVDPEFSPFPAIAASPSVAAVQDRESEAESSQPPVTTTHRRRSKRARSAKPQPDPAPAQEPEPVSSVSDATAEEDVAISLMMLSRDFWAGHVTKSDGHQYDDEEEEEEEGDEEAELSRRAHQSIKQQQQQQQRSKYQCGTCKKVFRSYQALGGHRASHKKTNGCVPPPPARKPDPTRPEEANAERISHVCPVCFRVFSSGQALGGHKRSHLASASAATITIASSSSNLIAPVAPLIGFDLNLPAPIEDDAEVSAVSDAEFVAARA